MWQLINLEGLFGLIVVGGQFEDLVEMRKGLVYVIIMVQTKATNVNSLDVGTVAPQKVIGHVLSFGISPQVSETFSPGQLEFLRGWSNFERLLDVVKSFAEILLLKGQAKVAIVFL